MRLSRVALLEFNYDCIFSFSLYNARFTQNFDNFDIFEVKYLENH